MSGKRGEQSRSPQYFHNSGSRRNIISLHAEHNLYSDSFLILGIFEILMGAVPGAVSATRLAHWTLQMPRPHVGGIRCIGSPSDFSREVGLKGSFVVCRASKILVKTV
jgi:hypothetical protein